MGRQTQIFLLAAASTLIVSTVYKFFIAEFAFAVTPGWNTKILPTESAIITIVLALTFFGGAYGIISLLISRKERE